VVLELGPSGGNINGFTAKSIPFAAADGTLTQANSFLQFDSSTESLGVGTAATAAALTVGALAAPVGSASAYVASIFDPAGTIAFATTPQTGDFVNTQFGIHTLTNPSSGTITNASTVKITGAPIASTNVTLTNTYPLWVASGALRVDDTILLGTAAKANNEKMFVIPNGSIGGSAALVIPGFRVANASTIAFTGATAQTGDVRVNSFGQTTLTNATAGTVTNAATLYIVGAPTAGSGMTITNAYAFWVASGASRFDGNVGFFSSAPAAQQTSGANLTNNVTSGGVNDTVADITAASVDTSAAKLTDTRNAVYQLARKLKQINDGLRLYGLFT